MKIEIEKCVYFVHPIYDLYAGSKDGNVIHITKRVLNKGHKTNRGYVSVSVRKHSQSGYKVYLAHRFIWECFNGVTPNGKEIDHINNDKEDNRLCNLQLLTPQQNCKKAAKERDYSFVSQNHKNRKCVKATNKDTDEESYYKSMYAVKQYLGVNVGIVKMACEGTNHCKSGVSKKDGHRYTFEYVKEEDLPDNYRKSANIRPKKVSEEDKKKHSAERVKKWKNKEYKCSNCDKVYKNGYKYLHSKKCK